ncbi:MAG TPA: hypothetical protein VFB95_09845 [Candidatus Cryosericum sp.]|nr:hypothetical protein [Candidatus Cryosericum sp.]
MMRRLAFSMALVIGSFVAPHAAFGAQANAVQVTIDPKRGFPGVDYAALMEIGPWDDRNYQLTADDLALLAPNEREQHDAIPAFFRVEMRRATPGLRRTGVAQYPRSALQIFELLYGGYLIDGKLYRRAVRTGATYMVLDEDSPVPLAVWEAEALTGDVRVSSPEGAAESAIKIHPLDTNKVIAGSNGPGSGQVMHYSVNGGSSWTQAAPLPLGSTCCDPTVDWSSDGAKAYASALGSCSFSGCQVWVYRSADGGQTWIDFQTVTPGDPRREVTTGGVSDKEYIHVDKFAASPRRDNVYLTWHDFNIMKFSRSTDLGNTWSAPLSLSGSGQEGIGSDIASDKNGNIYYFWPAFNARQILVRKSTDGGASFTPSVIVSGTQASFIFPIPAMETREAFLYVSADVDLTNGPYANRIYAAWTDTTGPPSGVPANNHGRIQVAFSADGGATWSLRTPHGTADAATVDRFHPWVGVGPDGTVHVIFYDTRLDASRTSVDLFYSKSTDGGNTWAAPIRLSSVTSPHIEDGFQLGDYNGLDAIGSQVIGIFTDNRNESGGAADSVDVYAAAAPAVCTPPPAPAGLSATTAGATQINLAWGAVAGVTGYHVLRGTASGGPYTQIGAVLAPATTFSDTTVVSGTTYYYVVRSHVGSCESADSNQASAVAGYLACVVDIGAGTSSCAGAITVLSSAGTQRVLRANTAGFQRLDAFVDLCNPTGFSFHLGDSPTNDGFGGDAISTQHDAEAHFSGTQLAVYDDDFGDLVAVEQSAIAAIGCYRVQWSAMENTLLFDNDGNPADPPKTSVESYELFELAPYAESDSEDPSGADASFWYVGLNRTVFNPSRTGAGVTKACFVLSATTAPAPATLSALCP